MSIHLYQIQYDDHTKPSDESGFIGFDVRDNPEFLKREMAHMTRFYDEIVSKGVDEDFYGLFSPKFNDKSGLLSCDILDFSEKNPDADLYIFNPFPIHVYKYLNVWRQGEEHHPNIIKLANQMFDAADFDFDVASLHRNSIKNTVYCNYWVAKKTFFDVFIPFVKKMDKAINDMPDEMKSEYFSETNYLTHACFYPFIFERLISSFLVKNPIFDVRPYLYSDLSKIHMGRVERSFSQHGGFNFFDRLESRKPSTELTFKELQKIQRVLSPKVYIPFFPFLGRWLTSLLKTYYILTMKKRF